MGMTTKACAKCNAVKPIEDFHKQPSGPMGRHSYCKVCANEVQRLSRVKLSTPEARRRWNLASRYKLDQKSFEKLLARQGGVCAICAMPPPRPVIDHDHKTGKVRGILCHSCNIKLPAIENVIWARNARRYLCAT